MISVIISVAFLNIVVGQVNFDKDGYREIYSDKNVTVKLDDAMSIVLCHMADPSQQHWMYSWATLRVHLKSTTPFNTRTLPFEANETQRPGFLESLRGLYGSPRRSANNSIVSLPLDQSICIKVSFVEQETLVNIATRTVQLDSYFVTCLFVGSLLVFMSPRISRNEGMFYLLGALLSCVLSLLFLSWVLYYMVLRNSKVPLLYVATLGAITTICWTALLEYAWDLLLVNRTFLLSYIVTMSLTSSAFIYYYEPYKNRKLLNLFMWGMQILGLVVVYFSSRNAYVSAASVLLLLTSYSLKMAVCRRWSASGPLNVRFGAAKVTAADGDSGEDEDEDHVSDMSDCSNDAGPGFVSQRKRLQLASKGNFGRTPARSPMKLNLNRPMSFAHTSKTLNSYVRNPKNSESGQSGPYSFHLERKDGQKSVEIYEFTDDDSSLDDVE